MDETMPTIHEIPFENILDILKETGEPLHPGYLYRFSDLEAKEIAMLEEIWGTLPLQNRQALMENLEQIGSEDMLLSFEAVGRFTLRDDDPKVRKSAVRILHEYELPDLITIFLQMLETDNNEEVRAEAARGLGQYVYLGEIEELPEDMQRKVEVSLLQALKSHQAPIVQQRALESLSFSSRDEVPPLIERAFSSEDKEWIATALVAMGRSADKRWETEVMAMLTNKYPTLRTEAARAAGELELTEAIPYLLDMLDDDSKDVRMASIWALSQIGGEGIRERLENLLASAREEDEVNLMENALDNLSFTEDFQLFSLFDFSERDIEEEILDVLGEEDFHQDEDNEDLLD
jgi:HEAT repeat protein